MKLILKQIRAFRFLPLIALGLSLAQAQDASSDQSGPPSPPYVAPLSGDFSLQKKFTYLTAPDVSTAPLTPEEVDAVKKGPTRKDVEHFVNGNSRTIWRQDAYRLSVDSRHPDSVVVDIVTNTTSPNAPYRYSDGADFPELSWIDGPMYQGIQTKQGKKCYAYKLGDQAAWIEVATQLPVYFESKTEQVTYTFSAPPEVPLMLPDGYAAQITKLNRRLRGQH